MLFLIFATDIPGKVYEKNSNRPILILFLTIGAKLNPNHMGAQRKITTNYHLKVITCSMFLCSTCYYKIATQ